MEKLSVNTTSYKYEPLSEQGQGHEKIARREAAVARTLIVLSHSAVFLLGLLACRLLDISFTPGTVNTYAPSLPLNVYTKLPPELLAYSETVRFNGTFDFPSIYRGRGDDVDEAWEELVEVGMLDIHVTPEEMWQLGINEPTAAKYPETEGGGYALTMETFHQLHCVDLLRKVTHWNYDYYKARSDKHVSFQFPDQMVTHVDHCLEMLRQNLMCHADPTLISHHYTAVRKLPWPDFNTKHQCRNFEALHSWARLHERSNQNVPIRPEGAARLDTPP